MSRVTDLYKWLATKDEETQKRVTDLLSEVMRLGDERNKANASLASAESALITLNSSYSDAMRRCDELTANLKTQGDSLVKLCDESNRQRAIIAGLKAELASPRASVETENDVIKDLINRVERLEWFKGQFIENHDEIKRLMAALATVTADRDMWQRIATTPCAPSKVAPSDSAYPRTLCEKCKGDEVSGCICGMVAP